MTVGSLLGALGLAVVAAGPEPVHVHGRLARRRSGDERHLLPSRLRGPDPLVPRGTRPRPHHPHSRRRAREHRLRARHRGCSPTTWAGDERSSSWRSCSSSSPRPCTGSPCAVRGPRHPVAAAAGDPAPGSPSSRTRPFLMLAAGLTLSGFAMYAVVFGLVPLLLERGASTTTAAWVLGLGGAGQTLGRLLYGPLSARTGATTRTASLVVAGGATTRTPRVRARTRPTPRRHRRARRDGPGQPHPHRGDRRDRPLGDEGVRPALRHPRGTGHPRRRTGALGRSGSRTGRRRLGSAVRLARPAVRRRRAARARRPSGGAHHRDDTAYEFWRRPAFN